MFNLIRSTKQYAYFSDLICLWLSSTPRRCDGERRRAALEQRQHPCIHQIHVLLQPEPSGWFRENFGKQLEEEQKDVSVWINLSRLRGRRGQLAQLFRGAGTARLARLLSLRRNGS